MDFVFLMSYITFLFTSYIIEFFIDFKFKYDYAIIQMYYCLLQMYVSSNIK